MFRVAAWRERAEDWFFGGLAVAIIVGCMVACAGSVYGPRNIDWVVIGVSTFFLVMLIVLAIIVAGKSLTNWLAFAAGIALVLFATYVRAGDLPTYSARYRAALEAAAAQRFGLDAPVARLAAQIQQESSWQPDAESAYAQGLAQFIPSTANWLPSVCPDIGEPDPWDALWSIRAVACYDFYLHARAPGHDECNRWAFALSDYNGGAGMRAREQRLTADHGGDRELWWENVERYNARSASAWRENRAYVRTILLRIEPMYLTAGWSGQMACR